MVNKWNGPVFDPLQRTRKVGIVARKGGIQAYGIAILDENGELEG